MVETSATNRSFPGWDAVPEDIIPDVDDTRDLGSEDKNWAYLWVAIAMVTSITIGGAIGLSNIDSWLFINASTQVNGSLNISEDLFVNGTLTAGNVDITNLTVENMNFTNLTITGDIFNISATETYVNDLFPNEYCTSDLGSIGLRWDNGYFCHNLTAEYIVADGRFLTNLPEAEESDPYWTANQSSYFNITDILGFNYFNSTDFSIADYFTSAQILGFSYYNSTDFDIADYLLIANWNSTNKSYYEITNPFGFYNSTNPQAELDPYWTGNLTDHNESWSNTFNQTQNDSINNYILDNNASVVNYVDAMDLIFNNSIVNWIMDQYYTITQINAINTSMNNYILDNNNSVVNHINLNNDSMGNYVVDYVGIQNTSLVNYIGTVNTSMKNYVDDTFVSAELDPKWTANWTDVAFENQANIFTANQNITEQNITAIDCVIFDSGGKICSGV